MRIAGAERENWKKRGLWERWGGALCRLSAERALKGESGHGVSGCRGKGETAGGMCQHWEQTNPPETLPREEREKHGCREGVKGNKGF